MALTIASIDTITATSARLVLTGGEADPVPGGSTRAETQISTNRDFRFAVSPMWTSAGGTVPLAGLNAGTTYYVRARNRFSTSVQEWGATNAFTTLAGTARDISPKSVMIEPAMIVVPESVLDIYWGNGEQPGFPARNLLIDAPVATRTIGPDAAPDSCVLIFRTSGAPVDTFALLASNMPESAVIEVWDATTQNNAETRTATTILPAQLFRASPNLPGRPGYHSIVRSASPLKGPWFAIRITGAPVAGRVKHFEHLIVGRNLVSKNHSVELTVAPQPLTTIDRRRSGVPDRVPGMPMRRVEFELSMLSEAQFESQYQELWRRENMPVLVVPNTKPGSFLHDRIFYGDLSGGRVTQSNIRYSRGLAVQSLT